MKAPASGQSYKLYGLVNTENSTTQFSPYVWKTIIGLRYLNVDFEQQYLTFEKIRHSLTKELGVDEIRVPVLQDTDGEWLRESFDIAQYLDRTHAVPKGKSLFLHGVGGREFCRFVNYWADTVLAPSIGGLVRPRTCASLPKGSESLEYFTKSRFGSEADFQSALSKSTDPKQASESFTASRKVLKLINSMLEFQQSQGKKFIGGDFSHADAAVFGWAMWNFQFAPESKAEVWEHDDNKAVKEWVGEMRALPGWEERDFAEIKCPEA